jgi:RND family efflux transporter MFP subunit
LKRIVGWLLLLAVLGAGGLALWRKFAQPIDVHARPVVRGPALATVFATGWIEAKERRLLRPPRNAVVERILAKEGDEVRAGDPLVQLRDTARDAKKERVRAELDRAAADLAPGSALRSSAQSKIDEAKVNETWAQSELDRNDALRKQGLLDERTWVQLVAARDAATQRTRALTDELAHSLADLETQRRQSSAELDTLVAAEHDDRLAAPFDGVVLQRFAEEGESVDPTRDLLKFGDVRDLLVEGEVDEEDVARVAVGQRVLVRVAGDVSALVEARVSELFPDSNRTTRTYRVRVLFPGASFVASGPLGLRGTTTSAGGRALIPGSSCELGIVVDQRDDVLVVPRVALTARGTLFVVEGDGEAGVARERRVALGLENFDRCEVREGVREGERVVVDHVAELRDGRRVTAREETPRPPASAATATSPSAGVVDLEGRSVDPLASAAKATVLLFTRADCPISNQYAPEVNRLVAAWTRRGVDFWLVYVDPKQTPSSVRQHAKDYGYTARIALDPRHELVRLVNATTTPEAALFTKERTLVYHGRIDDRFADVGVARAQPTTHEVEDALAAVLDGRTPKVASAPPVGCTIDDLR